MLSLDCYGLLLLFVTILTGVSCGKLTPVKNEESSLEGSPVTLSYTYSEQPTRNDYFYWYRQYSGKSPEFIISHLGTGGILTNKIPELKIKVDQNQIHLNISPATVSDSAVYYCALGYEDALTFGKAISLTVTPQDPGTVDTTLFVLSPLQPKDPERTPEDPPAPEICLATDFYPKEGEMVLNMRGDPISVNTTKATLSKKQKTYFYAGYTNETILSCELHNTPANNDGVDMCADLHPEKAKLNFLLVMMNGWRVVFTKALAFSTILTIYAVLY